MKSVWGFLLFMGVACLLLGFINYVETKGLVNLRMWVDRRWLNRKRNTSTPTAQMMRDYSEWWARAAIPIAVLGGLLAVVGAIGVLAR